MLLGEHAAARTALQTRLGRGESGPRIRSYARARADSATGILARLHPRYPHHLKSVPALLWAQTDELLHVRVRFARYTTGEAMARRVEHVNVTLRSGSLYVAAESALGSTPAFFETTIAWLHPLARADGCADSESESDGEPPPLPCASQPNPQPKPRPPPNSDPKPRPKPYPKPSRGYAKPEPYP